jgi:hypothetical protein
VWVRCRLHFVRTVGAAVLHAATLQRDRPPGKLCCSLLLQCHLSPQDHWICSRVLLHVPDYAAQCRFLCCLMVNGAVQLPPLDWVHAVTRQARVAGLALMDLSPVNFGFQAVLKQMLSGTASIRPSATAFQGATYFQVEMQTILTNEPMVCLWLSAAVCPSTTALLGTGFLPAVIACRLQACTRLLGLLSVCCELTPQPCCCTSF